MKIKGGLVDALDLRFVRRSPNLRVPVISRKILSWSGDCDRARTHDFGTPRRLLSSHQAPVRRRQSDVANSPTVTPRSRHGHANGHVTEINTAEIGDQNC